MDKIINKINGKLFEIGALVILKNKGIVNEEEFLKIKQDIETEYYINARLDFNNYGWYNLYCKDMKGGNFASKCNQEN